MKLNCMFGFEKWDVTRERSEIKKEEVEDLLIFHFFCLTLIYINHMKRKFDCGKGQFYALSSLVSCSTISFQPEMMRR